jgi:hypothetical protein
MGTLVLWSGIWRRKCVEFTKNIQKIFWRSSPFIVKLLKIQKGNMCRIYRKVFITSLLAVEQTSSLLWSDL